MLLSLIFLLSYPQKILISARWPFELKDVKCLMILVKHYAIRPPIPKTIFIKHCRVKIIAFPFVLFHTIVFSMSAALSVSNSLLHICLNSSFCHNVLILLSLPGVTNLSLLVGVCAACMLAYRYLQMKWWAAVTVVAISSQKALLMCPYVSSGKFSVLAPRCSRALLHNLQLTSDRCLVFASIWLPAREWSL